MNYLKLDPSWLEIINRKYSQYSPIRDFSPEGDTTPSKISWSIARKIVLDRDRYKCRVCGKASLSEDFDQISRIKLEVEVHHIIPRKIGGSNSFKNLISLCHSCHVSTFSNSYSGIPVLKLDKNVEFFTDIKYLYKRFPAKEKLFIDEYFINGKIIKSPSKISGYLCEASDISQIDETASLLNPDIIILKNPKNNKFIRGYLSP